MGREGGRRKAEFLGLLTRGEGGGSLSSMNKYLVPPARRPGHLESPSSGSADSVTSDKSLPSFGVPFQT